MERKGPESQAVDAFLDEIGPSTLVGNSMGGLISQMAAASRPTWPRLWS